MSRISEPEERAALRRYLPTFIAPPDASVPGNRMVDGVLIASAIALGGITQGYLWQSHGEVLDWLDVMSGAVACLTLWWRRAHPLAVFLIAFGASAFSPLALGAGLVAICTVTSRARGRLLMAVAVLAAVVSVVFPLVNPKAGEIVKVGFPAFLVTTIAFGWSAYLRARRKLVASLRERAERLEAYQLRAAEPAREAERRRIAPPQPGFGQPPDLLDGSRSAGMTLSQHLHLADPGELPQSLGRTVYRVIQEGLTNARKHAPGAPVTVLVTADGQAVATQITSRRPAVAADPRSAARAGAGRGLVGLAERVALAGGHLEHGPNAIGDFVVLATLPRQR